MAIHGVSGTFATADYGHLKAGTAILEAFFAAAKEHHSGRQ